MRTTDVATWQLESSMDLQRFDRVRLAWFTTCYGEYDVDAQPGPNWPPDIGVLCQQITHTYGSYDTAEKGSSRILGQLVIKGADEATGKVSYCASLDNNVDIPISPGSFETMVSLQLVHLLTGSPFPTLDDWVACLEFTC